MKLYGKILVFVIMLSSYKSLASEEHKHDHHPQTAPALATAPISEESIYNLKSELIDTNGKPFFLSDLRGKPVVISMAYSSCAHTCPLILSQMQQLEKAAASKDSSDVQFVLVSFDPKRDTFQVLAEYSKGKKLSKSWKLLTSRTDKEPREIANLLGIKYKKIEGGDYDHSFIITVLDREGVICGNQVGASADSKALMKCLP